MPISNSGALNSVTQIPVGTLVPRLHAVTQSDRPALDASRGSPAVLPHGQLQLPHAAPPQSPPVVTPVIVICSNSNFFWSSITFKWIQLHLF